MLKIVVSSLSNCREKNGVVTFMEILRRNAARFGDARIDVAFANYVDFPLRQEAATTSAQTPGTDAPQRKSRRWAAGIKQGIKAQLAKRPLLAFLMMMATLSRRALIAVLKARRLESAGCIHFHQDFFCAVIGQALLRADSRKVLLLHSSDDSLRQLFVHFHGMRGTRYETLIRQQFHRTLGKLDGIVTLNERYARTLREQFPGVDVRCIYNTSPFASDAEDAHRGLPRANEAEHKPIEIVAVGSLQHIKGFDLLVDAAAALAHEDRARLHVTIVGGGAERTSLQSTIDANGLQNIITLNGETNDVSPFLARADAYILTSRDEGFPIALIEASSFGLAIVSTRVGAIPEVFEEGTCLYIDARAESIRDALVGIGRGAVDIRELARRSKFVFDTKLSLEIFLRAYCRLFTDVGRHHAA
jgi:glycosyltransferase involved in cell wall biosynthesis